MPHVVCSFVHSFVCVWVGLAWVEVPSGCSLWTVPLLCCSPARLMACPTNRVIACTSCLVRCSFQLTWAEVPFCCRLFARSLALCVRLPQTVYFATGTCMTPCLPKSPCRCGFACFPGILPGLVWIFKDRALVFSRVTCCNLYRLFLSCMPFNWLLSCSPQVEKIKRKEFALLLCFTGILSSVFVGSLIRVFRCCFVSLFLQLLSSPMSLSSLGV